MTHIYLNSLAAKALAKALVVGVKKQAVMTTRSRTAEAMAASEREADEDILAI